MAIEIMSLVWRDFRGDPTAKLVLLSLADQANNEGWSWPSQAHTADRCMISDRQLRTWLKWLAAEGWIEVHKRPGKSDMYRVVTPEVGFRTPWKSASAHPGSGLPTNHKEPSRTIISDVTSQPRCPYCHKRYKSDKPHSCSAMNMLMR